MKDVKGNSFGWIRWMELLHSHRNKATIHSKQYTFTLNKNKKNASENPLRSCEILCLDKMCFWFISVQSQMIYYNKMSVTSWNDYLGNFLVDGEREVGEGEQWTMQENSQRGIFSWHFNRTMLDKTELSY